MEKIELIFYSRIGEKKKFPLREKNDNSSGNNWEQDRISGCQSDALSRSYALKIYVNGYHEFSLQNWTWKLSFFSLINL